MFIKHNSKLINNKGFTLIEILVAFTILGIIIMSFLPLFTNGYRTIFSAGQKSNAVFKAQEVMEGQLAGLPEAIKPTDYIEIIENHHTNLSINFGGNVIEVKGSTIHVQYNDDRHRVNFTSFMTENRGD